MVFRAIRPDWGPEVEERNRIAAVRELGGKERQPKQIVLKRREWWIMSNAASRSHKIITIGFNNVKVHHNHDRNNVTGVGLREKRKKQETSLGNFFKKLCSKRGLRYRIRKKWDLIRIGV